MDWVDESSMNLGLHPPIMEMNPIIDDSCRQIRAQSKAPKRGTLDTAAADDDADDADYGNDDDDDDGDEDDDDVDYDDDDDDDE